MGYVLLDIESPPLLSRSSIVLSSLLRSLGVRRICVGLAFSLLTHCLLAGSFNLGGVTFLRLEFSQESSGENTTFPYQDEGWDNRTKVTAIYFVCVKLHLYSKGLLRVIDLLNPQLKLKQFLAIQGDLVGPLSFVFKNSETRSMTDCWLSLPKRKLNRFLSRVNRFTMEPSNVNARCESKELKRVVQIKTCTAM